MKRFVPLSLAALLLTSVPAFAEKAPLKEREAGKAAAFSTEGVVEDLVLSPNWQPVPSGARNLSLKDALKRTLDENVDVLQAKEQIQESKARAQHAESQGLFSLFRYFRVGTADETGDVQAAEDRLDAVTQKSLLRTAEQHAQLMQAYMRQYLSYQAFLQNSKQLKQDQERFSSGQTTNIDVLKAKAQLMAEYQRYLDAGQTIHKAAYLLSHQIGNESPVLWYPQDLRFEDEDTLSVEALSIQLPTTDPERLVKLATEQRAELRELRHRIAALKKRMETAPFGTPEEEHRIGRSLLKQLQIQLDSSLAGIRASTQQAVEQLQLSDEKALLAAKQRDMAEKMLHQVQVSYTAGFSSRYDVLDAQVAYAQAQVNYANAVIERNLSQIRLLYELGQLKLPLNAANLT